MEIPYLSNKLNLDCKFIKVIIQNEQLDFKFLHQEIQDYLTNHTILVNSDFIFVKTSLK